MLASSFENPPRVKRVESTATWLLRTAEPQWGGRAAWRRSPASDRNQEIAVVAIYTSITFVSGTRTS